jgi:hypothetical protein
LEKKRAEQVLSGSRGLEVGGEVAQTMYTHVSKYKNDKITIKNGKINGSIFTEAYIRENNELLLHATIVDKS